MNLEDARGFTHMTSIYLHRGLIFKILFLTDTKTIKAIFICSVFVPSSGLSCALIRQSVNQSPFL